MNMDNVNNKKKACFYCYKNYNYQSNKIDTLVLSGGGYHGILYIALIQYLEHINEIKNIKKIYSVSVGTLFALLIIIGFTSDDCINLLLTDLSIEKIIDIQPQDIFNLIDKLGINNGSYLEDIIKSTLLKRGYSPYITLKELYELTHIEFNIGISYVQQNKFELINYKTHPDTPIWFALRSSTSIPLIFQPLYDVSSKDYICDGGILCNNPIKYALLDKYKELNDEFNQYLIQCNKDNNIDKNNINKNNIDTKDNELNIIKDISLLNQYPLMKYKTNIICIDFLHKQKHYEERPSLIQYILSLTRKLFVNQSGNNKKITHFIYYFNTTHYPEISYINFKLNNELLYLILNKGYKEIQNYMELIKN